MKSISFVFLLCMASAVPAFAQATHTLELGGNWAWDTKLPVQTSTDAFNKQFFEHMQAWHEQASHSAPAPSARPQTQSTLKLGTLPPAPKQVTCAQCGQKVPASEAAQPLDKAFYVHKHSSCACDFLKAWQNKQDLSFIRQASQRKQCQASDHTAYVQHACAVCGQPIDTTCGPVSVWQEGGEKQYAHADCVQAQRYEKAREEMMALLDVTETHCQDVDRLNNLQQQTRQEQTAALASFLQEAVKQPQVSVLTPQHQPSERKVKKARRAWNRFMDLHRQEMEEISSLRKAGKTLTPYQQKLALHYTRLSTRYNQLTQGTASKR